MYVLAEISAVFIAIFAGLYTTKLLSISSERKRIRNKISEIDAELEGKQPLRDSYKTIIQNILRPRAERSIQSFTADLCQIHVIRNYTLAELKEKFIELKERDPNEYEESILAEQLDSINEKITTEMRRQNSLRGLGSISALASAMSRENLLSNISSGMFNIQSEAQYIAEQKRWVEAKEKLIEEDGRKKFLETMKKQYELELTDGSFPKYLNFGLLAMFAIVIMGVIFPLMYEIWSPLIGIFSNSFALIVFILSLLGIFVYIAIEVKQAETI